LRQTDHFDILSYSGISEYFRNSAFTDTQLNLPSLRGGK
jgi:hypothetical protein